MLSVFWKSSQTPRQPILGLSPFQALSSPSLSEITMTTRVGNGGTDDGNGGCGDDEERGTRCRGMLQKTVGAHDNDVAGEDSDDDDDDDDAAADDDGDDDNAPERNEGCDEEVPNRECTPTKYIW